MFLIIFFFFNYYFIFFHKKILILLIFEAVMLLIIFAYSSFHLVSMHSSFFCLFLSIFMVLESILGITCLICSSRNGSFSSSNFLYI